MISNRRITGAMLALLVASAPVYSQSLGDLARQEELRRGTTKKATRSLSNGDLSSGGIVSTSTSGSSESCFMSISQGRCVTADELISKSYLPSAEGKRQEPMIRQEAAAIRNELSRVQQELDEFARTAADEKRPAARRSVAADALAKRRPILERLKQRWAKLERFVEQQRIPHEWIEPVPDLGATKPQ